ncbi:hypothetical protein E9840_11625 [Tissierella creatinini]|nr:hypothetical protein E9840_11625 [Tissierella creatinini]TJX60973.1 hypothetical protein E8P77_19245 [Soehngenia saccharolytica]
MERVLENKLIAVIPKYIPDQGNCTIIYTEKSEPLILENTITTVMKRIGRHYMVDLDAMKARNGKLINISYPVPISLDDDVFIPIKVRKPFGKNDKSFGYVNLEYIDSIKTDNSFTIIHLRNQLEIKCLFKKATLNKHISNGTIIKRFYEEKIKSLKISRDIRIAEDGTTIYESDRTVINLYLNADLLKAKR